MSDDQADASGDGHRSGRFDDDTATLHRLEPLPEELRVGASDAVDASPTAHRTGVLADAQARLDAQEREDEAGSEHREKVEAKLLGGLYTVPDRAWHKHIGRQEAGVSEDEAAMAARVAAGVEEAAFKDHKRAEADAAVLAARAAGAPLSSEAESILAEIEKDLDDSMTEAINTSAAASAAHVDARAGNPEATRHDADVAQAFLGKDSADLAGVSWLSPGA